MLITTWKHAYAAQATCYCCSVQYTILCTHQQFSLSAKCIILKLTNVTALFCIAHLSLALWSCVSFESLHVFLLVPLQNTSSRLPVMSGKRAHTNSSDGEQQQPAQVCFESVQISQIFIFGLFRMYLIMKHPHSSPEENAEGRCRTASEVQTCG